MDYGTNIDNYVFTQPQYTTFSSVPAPASMSASGTPAYVNCPHCGQECVMKYSEKNNNRAYYACNKPQFGGTCTNEKGWFKWCDEYSKSAPQKRPAGPPVQSPAKKQQFPQQHSHAPSPGVPRQVHVTPEMVQQSQAKPASQPHMDAIFVRLDQKLNAMAQKLDFLTAFITQHLGQGALEGAVDNEETGEPDV